MKTRRRRLTISLWLLLAFPTLACCVLPVIGAKGFFSVFRIPYSTAVHVQLLGPQLVGPAFTLLFGSFLVILLLLGKRVGWWLWLIALIGPVYTQRAVGGLGHDFSHVVFRECSGIYGTWILGLSIVSGACLVALACLDSTRRSRALPSVDVRV